MRAVTVNGGHRMRAWYDILGTDLARREDEAGLRQSVAQVHALIEREVTRGVPAHRIVLAGFSFGAYVQTHVAQALAAAGQPVQRLVLVGTAAGFVEGARQYAAQAVAADTIVIHGSADTTVPLSNVLAWAEPLDLPVVVVPGADHFFHRRLHVIRDIVTRAWRH